MGQHYTYLDNAGLVSGTTYSYWVEDVSTSGAATRHEPISVLYTGSSTGPNAIRVARFGAAAAPAGLPAAGLLLGGVAAGTGAWLRRRRRAA